MHVAEHLLDEELALAEEMAVDRARQKLLAFVQYVMPAYEVNWHHRVMADALDDVCAGRIKRLMIFTPPRSGKSELLSRKFPAFYLGQYPDHHVVATSYSHPLAKKGNRDVQRVMDTPEYRAIFPHTRISSVNARNSDEGSWLRNSDEFEIVSRRGQYRATSTMGSLTGFGMHLGIIDDPVKNRQEANSLTYRNSLYDWYTSTFYSRLEKNGAIILCLTRWHEDDLASRLLKLAESDPGADQWVKIVLPQVRESAECDYDPREIGDVLWPNKFSAERVSKMRASMGERDWASLHQQRPAPLDGGLVKDSWWRFYTVLPEKMDKVVISADLTFKDRGDFCSFQVWGKAAANFYLLHEVHDRMLFTQQCRVLEGLHQQFPQAKEILVEDAATGSAVIDHLKHRVPGILPQRPDGSKEARAEAVTPLIEAGNVYLPDSSICPWTQAYLQEWRAFPNGPDDRVDAGVYALRRLDKRRGYGDIALPWASSKQSRWLPTR